MSNQQINPQLLSKMRRFGKAAQKETLSHVESSRNAAIGRR
jgi:hypothetical protein